MAKDRFHYVVKRALASAIEGYQINLVVYEVKEEVIVQWL
jgi:hypothetical protein